MTTNPDRLVCAASDHLIAAGIDDPSTPVLVAVSGGVDSVVAAHVVRALGHPVVIAHVRHGLRGEESDRDAEWVADLAGEWGCPLQDSTIAAALAEGGSSLQDRARRLRYAALEASAREAGIGVIVTGHHRDDQAETVLIQLLRGSGPEGLSGMPLARPLREGGETRLVRPVHEGGETRLARPLREGGETRLLRPLLECSRDEIEEYARRHNLSWREDPSNQSEDYLRNAIRSRVIPELDRLVPGGAAIQIARSAHLIRGYREGELAPLTRALLAGACRPLPPSGLLVLESVLAPLGEVWRGRLMLHAIGSTLPGATQSASLARRALDLLDSQKGRRVDLPGGALWREREGLAVIPDRALAPETPLPAGADTRWGALTIRLRSISPAGAQALMRHVRRPDMAILEASGLPGPLSIRPWRDGDRVRPPGMAGRRKVKDILTDAGVYAHARRHIGVVCAAGRVVWIVGHVVDSGAIAGEDPQQPLLVEAVTG